MSEEDLKNIEKRAESATYWYFEGMDGDILEDLKALINEVKYLWAEKNK